MSIQYLFNFSVYSIRAILKVIANSLIQVLLPITAVQNLNSGRWVNIPLLPQPL